MLTKLIDKLRVNNKYGAVFICSSCFSDSATQIGLRESTSYTLFCVCESRYPAKYRKRPEKWFLMEYVCCDECLKKLLHNRRL